MAYKKASKYVVEFIKKYVSDEDDSKMLVNKWTILDKEFKKVFKERKKKVKIVGAPKRNLSAYILFSNSIREEVKRDYPDLVPKQILSKIGELWNKLQDDPEKLKEFTSKALQDKVRYDEEMKNFVPPPNVLVEKNKPKQKRGKSAYNIFCKEMRDKVKEENPEFKSKDILTKLGEEWNKLKKNSPEKVKEFENKSNLEKERLKDEDDEDTKEKPKKRVKKEGEPDGVKSSYIYFSKDERKILKDEGFKGKELTAELSDRWKLLKKNDEKKYNKYQKMHEKDKKRYEKEMIIFKEKVKEVKEESENNDKEEDSEEEDDNKTVIKKIIKELDDNGKSITKKMIKDELKKLGKSIPKDELNEIIDEITADE